MKYKSIALISILMITSIILSACGEATPEPTATLSVEQIQTNAVGTFSAGLTQTALANPTETPTPTSTSTPLVINTLPVLSPVSSPVTVNQQGAACYGMTYVSDINIPDDTPMTAGQKFTKTWQVKNTGSCAWDTGFKFAFVSGDPMSGVTYTFPSSVAPDGIVNISVDMVAPTDKTGTIKSIWRMTTEGGQPFGNEVYVQIVIGGGPTATATVTVTPTP